jgi:hypothetical protein
VLQNFSDDPYLKKYGSGTFPTDWRELMKCTDHEVLAALRDAASSPTDELRFLAFPLMNRKHLRTIYEQVSTHKKKRPTVFEELFEFAKNTFGPEQVRADAYGPKSERNNFLVLTEDGSIESSLEVSGVIAGLAPVEFGFIFVAPDLKEKAKSRIGAELQRLLNEGTGTSKGV